MLLGKMHPRQSLGWQPTATKTPHRQPNHAQGHDQALLVSGKETQKSEKKCHHSDKDQPVSAVTQPQPSLSDMWLTGPTHLPRLRQGTLAGEPHTRPLRRGPAACALEAPSIPCLTPYMIPSQHASHCTVRACGSAWPSLVHTLQAGVFFMSTHAKTIMTIMQKKRASSSAKSQQAAFMQACNAVHGLSGSQA